MTLCGALPHTLGKGLRPLHPKLKSANVTHSSPTFALFGLCVWYELLRESLIKTDALYE